VAFSTILPLSMWQSVFTFNIVSAATAMYQFVIGTITRDHSFRDKFFQMPRLVCQILLLTAGHFPHNFLWPPEPDQICSICCQ